MSLDPGWNQVLHTQDCCLRFPLNAVQDSLPIPSSLKHWQLLQDSSDDGLCPLVCRVAGST